MTSHKKIDMKLYLNQAINEASDANNIFLRTATFTLTLALESCNLNLIKIFFILNICVKLQQNRSINEGARAITTFF